MKITMPRTPRALRTGSSLLVNRISWATLGVFATAAVLAAQDPGRQAVRYHDCTGWRGTIVARGVADASSFAMVAAALRDKKVALDLDYSLYSEVEFELTTMGDRALGLDRQGHECALRNLLPLCDTAARGQPARPVHGGRTARVRRRPQGAARVPS